MQLGKWLVLFCDEINLPDMDQYGTQRVISFLRQLLEHKGFFRASGKFLRFIQRRLHFHIINSVQQRPLLDIILPKYRHNNRSSAPPDTVFHYFYQIVIFGHNY